MESLRYFALELRGGNHSRLRRIVSRYRNGKAFSGELGGTALINALFLGALYFLSEDLWKNLKN